MADKEKDRRMDDLLDSLLSSYSAADPRPGYETRLHAVVTARATRVRRMNLRILAASAAVLVLVAWIMLAKMRTEKTDRAPAVAREMAPAPANGNSIPAVRVIRQPSRPAGGARSTKVRSYSDSRLVLEMAEATHGSRSLVFEREKLYLTPTAPPEPEAAPAAVPAEQAQAPGIDIQNVGVAPIAGNAPIEIKDLAPPPKSATEKGSL